MKRFLIPFSAAVLIHVLLLRLQGDWLQKRLIVAQPAPIALALTYLKHEPPAPPPPQEKTPQKEPPKVPETKKIRLPDPPKTLPPEKPPVAKPKKIERKPPPIVKPPKEIVKKPPPKPPVDDEKPVPDAPLPDPAALNTKSEPSVPVAASLQRIPADSPPQPDVKSDKEQQIASLTPVKKMIEAVPSYRRNPPPGYPRIARRRGYEGTVVLEVLVSREGRVSDLRLFQSCGYEILDEAAEETVRSWVFDPGTIGDEPVEMWVKVPVRFELKR